MNKDDELQEKPKTPDRESWQMLCPHGGNCGSPLNDFSVKGEVRCLYSHRFDLEILKAKLSSQS